MKINKVRYCRVKADMTQLELSAKMGISNTHLNRIESGASPLSEKMAIKLSIALGVDVNDLCEDTEETG